MRIAFLDTQKLDYTAETPYQRPLGGSQSALCYLAADLARLGHEVSVLNATTTPGHCRGAQFLHLAHTTVDFLPRHDIVVVLNWARGLRLRHEFGLRVPLVLWLSHAPDQPVVSALAQPEERDVWSGFAFVSEWQRERFVEQFRIPRQKARVLRYAISPAFADTPLAPAWFERGDPPVLVYTSTPFRGLDVLLAAFRAIRCAIPDIRLRVFSSMAVYQVPAAQDEYWDLYAECAATDGADYCGPVGQRQLAQELRGIAGLAYPSTFAETSCIAVLEAMAAGAFILTTRLGALPETTNGFAFMVAAEADRAALAERFAAMTIRTLRGLQGDPSAASRRRDAQANFVRDNYRWPARAAEWASWLAHVAGR
jgi:glycosyltransferase involved in cell wall biosynthesis